jgi:hypothetical protein
MSHDRPIKKHNANCAGEEADEQNAHYYSWRLGGVDPRRWHLIDDIFDSAPEHPPAERGAFLDRARRGDESLRREVESLLGHDRPGGFIDRPCFEDAARLLAGGHVESPAGQNPGSYKIQEELGAGGMGWSTARWT